MEAFRRALKTWAEWVDKNVNPEKKLVFYRGYSSAHFRYFLLQLLSFSFDLFGPFSKKKRKTLFGHNSFDFIKQIAYKSFTYIIIWVVEYKKAKKEGQRSYPNELCFRQFMA